VDGLWHFVVGPTGSVLFSEHLPLLRVKPSSLTSSTISKAAALHAYILFLSFFYGSVAPTSASAPATLLYLPPHPKHTYYYYITRPHMRIYVLLIYICIHTIIYYSRAYIYIRTHCHTRAHIHTPLYISLYVYPYIYIYIYIYIHIYIYTQLHIYYIIVLYVSEKERPVDYGRSAFLVSESM